jgi:RND family efflux transporter MFP subunit
MKYRNPIVTGRITHDAQKRKHAMKIKHYIALILAFVVVTAALAFWYVSTRASAVKPFDAVWTQPGFDGLITTSRPAVRVFSLRVPWIGTVESKASVGLTALVAGRIEAIDVEDQAHIEKGWPVMRLGGPKVENARAKLTAGIESLGTQVDLARQTLVRLKESLKTRLATKDQAAAAQEAKVKLEAQLRDARLNLKTLNNQIHITAPMNGIFTNRRVSAGQDVAAGQVVGDIIDTGRLRVAASLFPPQDMELQGKEAIIRLSENLTLTGIIRQVLPRASSTGAVTVWIEGPQIDAQLHPGQTVGGDIVVNPGPGTLAVPESAIVYDSREHPFLFIRKESAYEPLGIQTGLEQDGWVEILSGLKKDQLVVTQGAYELFYRKFNEQFKVQD